VHFDPERAARLASRPSGDRLRIVFVGQPVERKGLPLLIRAFEALQERVPAELIVVGPSPREVSSLLLDDRGVHALGKVDEDRKRAVLEDADVLCAPSLGGESFGMVLTEAFASGTPVVASDIAGYREVVHDGVDGILVPPGDAHAIAEALYGLYRDPDRRHQMARAAVGGVCRFAWPRVAAEVLEAYQDARATPAPNGAVSRAGVRIGALPADLKPRVPARRLPSLEPRQRRGPKPTQRLIRRASFVALSLVVAALAVLAVRKVGLHHITAALLRTDPLLAVLGLAFMCGSMVLRGVSWHAVLRAALPRAPLGRRDVMRALFIGVLVSSVLPASLGEPTRALIISRRSGRPWENLPVVFGTLMSQTLLNIATLTVLGAVTFGSVDLFAGHETVLIVGAVVVLLVLLIVVLAPTLLDRVGNRPRWHRVQTVASRVRTGLAVFGQPRMAAVAVGNQLAAWGFQCVSVYALLAALHLNNRTGFLGAVAVLFGVNVTMLLPATPGDVGVFQAAAAAILHAGWQVPYSTGVAFGVILQGVEVAAALLMGVPALLLEGLSWRQLTQRPSDMAPVHLPPLDDPSSLRPVR
jgi:phosphatidylinositol alpha-mannosyltransferase